MKKRIKEDGVVYTIDATSGNCIDIDVKPGVEEVNFGASFGREYLLSDCKKVFLTSGKSRLITVYMILTFPIHYFQM